MTKDIQMHLLIRGHNCAPYLKHCIDSLLKQSYAKWKALIWLDAPEDNSAEIAWGFKEPRIFIHHNKDRLGVGGAMYNGLAMIGTKLKPDEKTPVGILDADDWLSKNALQKVMRVYNHRPDIWVTYGSFVAESKHRKTNTSKPYDKKDNVRKARWRASHFKTFRYGLFPHLEPSFFKFKRVWLQGASDFALMMPLIELAGIDRTFHVPNAIYHYRNKAKERCNRKTQKACSRIVRKKKPLKRLP